MKDGEDALGTLIDLLNDRGVDYMIVGSFSSNRYGVARATKDADLVLRLEARDLERLLAALPPELEVDPQASFEMVTGTWRRIIEVPSIPFTIELFELSADEHDRCRFARRKSLTLLGRTAWLPLPEDVIVQKLRWAQVAKRGKDFDDVVSIMAVMGESALDWDEIGRWCEIHGSTPLLERARDEASQVWGPEDE